MELHKTGRQSSQNHFNHRSQFRASNLRLPGSSTSPGDLFTGPVEVSTTSSTSSAGSFFDDDSSTDRLQQFSDRFNQMPYLEEDSKHWLSLEAQKVLGPSKPIRSLSPMSTLACDASSVNPPNATLLNPKSPTSSTKRPRNHQRQSSSNAVLNNRPTTTPPLPPPNPPNRPRNNNNEAFPSNRPIRSSPPKKEPSHLKPNAALIRPPSRSDHISFEELFKVNLTLNLKT